jgi:transcription initiation factor TFIIIB Brf1 subunit/transcription initiation factor TFIIB
MKVIIVCAINNNAFIIQRQVLEKKLINGRDAQGAVNVRFIARFRLPYIKQNSHQLCFLYHDDNLKNKIEHSLSMPHHL